MNFKHKLLKPGLLLLVLFSFLIGQDAWAGVTKHATTSGTWTTLTWSPAGVPATDDDVVIDNAVIVTLNQDVTVNSLLLQAGAGVAGLNVAVGDTVTLTVNGNINMGDANSFIAGIAAPTGRLNLTIGGASTITSYVDANGTTLGMNIHNFTIANANVIYGGGDHDIRMTGDLSMTGTSSFTPGTPAEGNLVFYGGYETIQNITVSSDSYCEFVNITTANDAAVATTADLTVTGTLTVDGTAPSVQSFTATAGTMTFTPSVALPCITHTTITTNANIKVKLNNVLFNCATAAATPVTSFIVGGDFTKIGTSNFAPTAGVVVFENADPVGKNIQFLGAASNFFGLQIGSAPNFKFTKVKTTSDFSLTSTAISMSVVGTSSFIAEAGLITVSGASTIANAIDATLKFNDLTIGAATATSSSFTIGGALTAGAGTLVASAGTITFENSLEKSITNSGAITALTFNGLAVANDSKVKTSSSFTIGTATGGGISVGTNAHFSATANTIDFAGASTKTIVNNDSLAFFNVTFNAGGGPVTTASDFTVRGTAFTIAGTSTFTANGGTVTFTGDAVLTSATASSMIFNNIVINDVVAGANVTVDAGDFVHITGNMTVNGTSSTFIADPTATVTFQGTTNSIIGVGTAKPASPAVTLGLLVINKSVGGSDEVLLATDMLLRSGTSPLTLSDGILNLGSKTLTVQGTTIPTATNGRINGATGTYVVSTGHADGLTDALFTINGTPTLYNLTIATGATYTTGPALTINGDLDWTTVQFLTIANPGVVTLYGNLKQTALGKIDAADPVLSKLVLKGTGTAVKLDDDILITMPSLTFERGETLTGPLTLVGNVLTINSSINVLDLGAYTLSLDATTVLNLISGSIKADIGSVVLDVEPSQTTIPANLFTGNTIKDLTIKAATTLGSDLTINGALARTADNITTNNNTLTLGPGSSVTPAFDDAKHVIGNLAQTVTSTAKVFHVGGGDALTYRPVAINFATLGSTQVIKVSSALTNPTVGRAGDPVRAINSVWTITPSGTAPADSMRIDYGWGNTQANGLATANNTTFAARWNSSYWRDYRNEYSDNAVATFTAANSIGMTAARFPIKADSISGTWAVFVANGTTDVIKNAAITNSSYKMAITNVSPNPVRSGFPFSVTVQLQDRYGNPAAVPAAEGAYTVNLTTLTGTGTALTGTGTVPVVIPVGESMATVSGLSISVALGAGEYGTQLKAHLTNTPVFTTAVLDGISEPMSILADQPTAQASGLDFTGTITATSIPVTYTLAAGNSILIAKAGSPITEADFPVDGTTYFANSTFGSGSAVGDAVVVFKGSTAPTALAINGLAPNTTYYFRAFAYTGPQGAEKYLTFSAANNPKSKATIGSSDDDVVYGNNDTRTLARPIGTNSVIAGRIDAAADEDWFSFAVTSISPNIRARLYDLPGNYTLELYDMTGRRIRRSTLNGTSNEALIANDLPAGTYTVRILSSDGSAFVSPGDEYYLKVTTSGSEIFSVTP